MVWATITEHHRLRGWNNTHSFLIVLEPFSCEGQDQGASRFSAWWRPISLFVNGLHVVFPHGGQERPRTNSPVSSYKSMNPIHEDEPSLPNYLSQALSPDATYEFRAGRDIQSIKYKKVIQQYTYFFMPACVPSLSCILPLFVIKPTLHCYYVCGNNYLWKIFK